MSAAAIATRIALLLAVPGFGWIGVRFLITPNDMAANMGMRLLEPAAVSTIQTGFGAFHIAIALIAAYCALAQRTVLPGLMIAVTMTGMVVFSRGIGLYTDGLAPQVLPVFAGESTMLTILAAGLIGERWRLHRTT